MKKLCLLLLFSAAQTFAAQPNIVIIMTDDQGYGDLGVMGNPVLETPHIDALAARSASVERFYVSPVCTPTRASLMTGRYNYRTRAVDTWIGRAMMEPEENTLAELLKAGGYTTGLFGKWHLGDCYPMRPQDQGFDEVLMHRGGGLAQPSEPLENGKRYTDPILWRNGEQLQAEGYCTDIFFDAASAWIGKQDKPWFVYLPMNAPHGPFHDVPQALYEKYLEKDLSKVWANKSQADKVARIYAMNENVDQNVGKLMARLDALKATENTIVIYLHDNGANGRRYSAGLRGNKATVYEGGIRTPFFFHWPARIKAGTAVKELAGHIDILPTLLDAAGLEPPRDLDGISILRRLEGLPVKPAGRTLYLQSHRGDVPASGHMFAAVEARWKLLRSSGFGNEQPDPKVPWELYDLQADPGEKKNLAAVQPEVVARMKANYARWFEQVSATRPDNYAPPRIVLGNPAETETWLTKQDWRDVSGPGWGTSGRWLVTVEKDAAFDVKVVLETAQAGKAELKIGSTVMSKIVPEQTGVIHFKDVKVPAGDGEVRFTLVSGDTTTGPYQVGLYLK